MFADNLGNGQYVNGDFVRVDVFDDVSDAFTPGDGFMKCNILFGDYATGMPAKIVCGYFLQDITPAMKLQFALAINSPILASKQISIPLMIYTTNPLTFTRTNYNLVTSAGYFYDTSNILSKSGFPTTTSLQM